jgi:deoxyribonuclease-4
MTETGIQLIASHMSYLVNLASPDPIKHRLSCRALKNELLRSGQLGIQYVVLHPGAHMGKGETAGLNKIAKSINTVFAGTEVQHPQLLLETTAGQGSALGYTFEQLKTIMDGVEKPQRIGFCLDSCHIFAAGYDIRTVKGFTRTLHQFDTLIGLEHLRLIHLNDAKKGLKSHVDRHAHIGEGHIGVQAFRCFMNHRHLQHIPKIIETPKEKGDFQMDRINLDRLRAMVQ